LGVKDKSGNIFKWMAYGNMHHVEIIQHKETGKYKDIFVTMMEAHRRAMTGTSSAQRRKINRESIILQNHGDEWQFVMALHRNDLVSVFDNNGERIFYRVQKLGGGYDLTLRLHSETTTKRGKTFIENKKMLENSFNNFLSILDLKVHKINAIGIITNDKANY
jgi:CRISPR-associated endonuclease Csn1